MLAFWIKIDYNNNNNGGRKIIEIKLQIYSFKVIIFL